MTKQSIAVTTKVRTNFHTGIDCNEHIKPKIEPSDSPQLSPSSGQDSPQSSGEGIQSSSLSSSLTSPLERCMTSEEIALLSENCATPLERDLISYLKMQQQQQQHQQQQQNQGLQHLHHQPSINRPKQLTTYQTYTNRNHHHHHHNHQDVKSINNNDRMHTKAYQTLTNAPVGPNLSSPTDIANYMSGQNPMNAPNMYYESGAAPSTGLPMPLSQIKKEPDQDHSRKNLFTNSFNFKYCMILA